MVDYNYPSDDYDESGIEWYDQPKPAASIGTAEGGRTYNGVFYSDAELKSGNYWGVADAIRRQDEASKSAGAFDPSLYGQSKTVGVNSQTSRPQSMQNPWGTPTTKRKSTLFSSTGTMSGMGGGGQTQYKPATGQVTTITPVKPGIPMPTLGDAPKFTLPTRDESRVNRLTQEAAAPGMRSLRRQTRIALMRQHYDDPRARENIRAILSGHGEALSKVMGTARQQGRAEYQQERAEEIGAAQINYQGQLAKWKATYQAALNDYFAQYGQKQVTKKSYDQKGIATGEEMGTGTSIVHRGYGMTSGISFKAPSIWG